MTRKERVQWINHIIEGLDGPMRIKNLPIKPTALNGWTPSMIRDASKMKDSPDKKYVAIWRSWIRASESVEMENRSNLGTLLSSLIMALEIGFEDVAELIKKFLYEEWEIGDEQIVDYINSTNRVRWIHLHANKEMGPTPAERDPGGVKWNV